MGRKEPNKTNKQTDRYFVFLFLIAIDDNGCLNIALSHIYDKEHHEVFK